MTRDVLDPAHEFEKVPVKEESTPGEGKVYFPYSTPVFLPGESQGREPGGLPSWGHTESDTTEAT